MASTPKKQPAMSDLSWVDVDCIVCGPGEKLSARSWAVQREESFLDTVRDVMKFGIWSEDGHVYTPPSAVIRIRNRRP